MWFYRTYKNEKDLLFCKRNQQSLGESQCTDLPIGNVGNSLQCRPDRGIKQPIFSAGFLVE